jgi:hypothetical protein
MTLRRIPTFDKRRRTELHAELLGRARAWLPEWRPRNQEGEFGTALLEIAARFSSEVTQRLDRVPEKTFRGFLHWLGVGGRAGEAARLPVSFVLAEGSDPVLAEAQTQLQAPDLEVPVVFETESPLRIMPGRLASLVSADPATDAYYLPPGAVLATEAPLPSPDEWIVKARAAALATQVQLTPELGLDRNPVLFHVPTGRQYRVTKADGEFVTLDPPIGAEAQAPEAGTPAPAGFNEGDRLRRVSLHDPFSGFERNQQEHAVYIGSSSLLNLKSAATIAIENGGVLANGVTWSYWGKKQGSETVDWHPMSDARLLDGELVLEKPDGDVEEREIGGKKGRWLRGVVGPAVVDQIIEANRLRLRVNCMKDAPECPPVGNTSVEVEAISNTTPVVLNTAFLPFGREPRLFDTFYVGSEEAFSKANANAFICFDPLNPTATSYTAALIGQSDDVMAFGIGGDGQMYRLLSRVDSKAPTGSPDDAAAQLVRFRPIHPPYDDGATAAPTLNAFFNSRQRRLTSVTRAGDVLVAMTAGPDVWLWQQMPVGTVASRWHWLGPIRGDDGQPVTVDEKKPPSVVIVEDGAGFALFAVANGVLYKASLAQGPGNRLETSKVFWERVTVDTHGEKVETVAPVMNAERRLRGGTLADGLLAVTEDGALYLRNSAGVFDELMSGVDPTVLPLGLMDSRAGALMLVVQSGSELHAARVKKDKLKVESSTPGKAVASFDWIIDQGARRGVVFTLEKPKADPVIATWFPFVAGDDDFEKERLYESEPIEDLRGAPALTANRLVAPGANATVIHRVFSINDRPGDIVERGVLRDGLLIESSHPAAKGDFIVINAGTPDALVVDLPEPFLLSGRRMFEPNAIIEDESVLAFHKLIGPGPLKGRATKPTTIEFAMDDKRAKAGSMIIVEFGKKRSVHEIDSVDTTVNPRVAEVIEPFGKTGNVQYSYVEDAAELQAQIRPFLQPVPRKIASHVTERALYVRGATPSQRVVASADLPDAMKSIAVLEAPWDTKPLPRVQILAPAFVGGPPAPQLPPQVTARVSWEYWNGSSWRRIEKVTDGTQHFSIGGVVRFCVPKDLQPTDVTGRKNHWVRARLVDGDYGQEKVTFDGKEVHRDTSGIHAPEYNQLLLNYSVCCATLPDRVITRDSGSFRDQTDANRISGGVVELFMPLSAAIRRLGQQTSLPQQNRARHAPRPDCVDCLTGAPVSTTGEEGDAISAEPRAIYLGFSEQIDKGPISILFLAEAADNDGAFPLIVEVLRETGFEPVTAQDETRGLNESGVITFSLDAPAPLVSLFGDERYWVRLRANERVVGLQWRPRIRAAFLNATWAKASETQAMEMLGSSDGSPQQRVALARPPVLERSLRLRVREPLGDEEKDELRQADADAVSEGMGGRPGTWVLWHEVDDLTDAAPDERAFSLDDETGDVTFGDGRNGRIPPIGRDVIMAEHYQRGGGERANAVKAWSRINLISPIQGVETVFAPDAAAGGSDPQTDENVVRFAPANQRIRDRALSLRDFETLALQQSAEIAQARARRAGSGVSLVIVMRGRDPTPSPRVRRELVNRLSSRAAPLLTGPGRITIVPPETVAFRIRLQLTIAAIEQSGPVTAEAERRIEQLLDVATGGHDANGWPLGVMPSETDVAAALQGQRPIEGLEEIDGVEIWLVGVDGELAPPPRQLKPTALAVLVPNGIAVSYSLLAAEAMS